MDEFLDTLTPKQLSELKEAIENNIYSELLEGFDGDEIDSLEEVINSDPYIYTIETYREAFADNDDERYN